MMKRKLTSIIVMGVFILSMVFSLSAKPIHVQAQAEDGLVAYWTFDENYTETVGGLTTNLGADELTYAEGVHGKAAVFDGKDNYLVVDADPILNLGNDAEENNDNFSISAWVNLGDSTESSKYLLDKGNDSGWVEDGGILYTNPYRVRFETNSPYIDLSNNHEDYTEGNNITTEGSSATGGKYVDGQEWFLLTITYDGKRVKIYHDNLLLAQNNYTDGIAFNNEELYIGADCKLSYYFKGMVDDLKLYTKTLSYDDVDALYESGVKANKELVEPTKQMVADYAFDDDLKDSTDFKNTAEKVAVGGTTKYIVGKNGKAITMSKGNYILVPAADQLNFDSEFSFSFWIKLNADVEEDSFPVFYRQDPANGDNNDNEWTYYCYIGTWGGLENTRIDIGTNVLDPDDWAPATGARLSTDVTFSKNKLKSTDWIHYTATYKDGELKSYVNGVLNQKMKIADITNIVNASGDLLIGYDGETFISGAIDELRVYNSCLTPTDVEKEYKRVDTISFTDDTKKDLGDFTKGSTIAIKSIILHDVDLDKDSEIKIANNNVSFVSSNSKIVAITSDGKIKGVKAGNAKVTIVYGGITATYNVVVKAK